MILKNLHISSFGKYEDETMEFSEGLNVIFGENGSGKTTLHQYLRAMLFGLERARGKAAKTDAYSHYYPWKSSHPYGGSLTFENESGSYRIERTFDTKNKSLCIRRDDNGQVLGDLQQTLTDLTGGLTEDVFRNTISIDQMHAATEDSLSKSLTNHLSSITFSGSQSLDVTGASVMLAAQKKEMKSKIVKDANTRYEALLSDIDRMENDLAEMSKDADDLDDTIKDLEGRIQEKRARHAELTEEIEATTRTIEANSMSKISDLANYPPMIRDTYTSYRLAKSNPEMQKMTKARKRNFLLMLVLAALVASLSLGIFYFEKLPFTLGDFVYPRIPFAMIFWAIALVIVLVAVNRFRHLGRIIRAAWEEENKLTDFLTGELRTHLGTGAINDENIQALTAACGSFAVYKKDLSDLKDAREIVLEETVALQSELQDRQADMAECQKEAWEYEQICKKLSKLDEEKAGLERTMERNKALETEIEAISMAEKTIADISAKLRESISPALNARVSDIIYAITDGMFERLYVDEDLSITLRSAGRTVPMDSMSRGTIEQIYLALRIAAAEILYPDLALPILLDDTFIAYDDARLKNTLRWLSENYPGQVLLFTCQKRETSMLAKMGANYNLITI